MTPNSVMCTAAIGRNSKLCFNAHRIYTALQVVTQFSELGLTLREFTYIPEKQGGLLRDADVQTFTTDDSYGCGCFWFSKEK